MTKYRSFVVGDTTFGHGDYVYVNHGGLAQGGTSSEPAYWIARVVEVRAQDAHHVYVRVFWCYWPSELPGGRRLYHGQDEIVPSNHMDVIDAMDRRWPCRGDAVDRG